MHGGFGRRRHRDSALQLSAADLGELLERQRRCVTTTLQALAVVARASNKASWRAEGMVAPAGKPVTVRSRIRGALHVICRVASTYVVELGGSIGLLESSPGRVSVHPNHVELALREIV
jgi:hypothetical protein